MRYQQRVRGFLRVSVRALAAIGTGLVLILATQTSIGTRPALARPTGILALDPSVVNTVTQASCAPTCDLTDPVDLLTVADADGDGDGIVEASDFATLDVDANHLDETSGILWILAFVTNDDPVWFVAYEGVFVESGLSHVECFYFYDEDCDEDGTKGDGVVVVTLVAPPVLNPAYAPADPGAARLSATQDSIDVVLDYTVGEGVGEPRSVLALSPLIVNNLTQAACAPSCQLTNPVDLLAVADADGDGDGKIEASDFAGLDLDGNQLNENDGELWILAFVTNDMDVWFNADEGIFWESGTSSVSCDFVDEDCDDDGMEGDDVVVVTLLGNGVADRGDWELVVTQSGVDLVLDYSVVGESAPVGGIAEYPQLEPGATSGVGSSSGPNALALAKLASGSALLLAAGAWYTRRRWLT